MTHVAGYVTCRRSEVARIRITCRCGQQSVVEVPRKIAEGLNIHPCPACGRLFAVQLVVGSWRVEPMGQSVRETAFRDVE